MSNGWTPERRAKQAQAIQRWKPWERSTGPVSEEGKAISSRNAFKGGHMQRFREMARELNKLLRMQRNSLEG